MKIIAIDTGATKSRVLLLDSIKSSRYREISLGPCNFMIHGSSGIKKLANSIKSVFNINSFKRYYLVAGIAGAVNATSREKILRNFISSGFKNESIKLYSDSELLHNSVGNNGIVLIAGTGAICVGRIKLQDGTFLEAKAGGYGFRFNSEPGGYSMGIKAIGKCLEIEDGISDKDSMLCEAIKNLFNVKNLRDSIAGIYESEDKSKLVPGLVTLVFKFAEKKDPVSLNLLREQSDTLSSYIKAVYLKLGMNNTTVYLHGGQFKNKLSKKFLIDPIKNHEKLSKLNLKFKTLGVHRSDPDPLVEIIRNTLSD